MAYEPTRWRTTAGVLGLAVVLAGCGSGGSADAGKTAVKASAPREQTASVPAAVRGSWVRRMRAGDWKAAGQGYPLGAWRLDVDAKGTAGVYLPRTDTVDFTTAFAMAGDRLTIDAVPICPGVEGHYTWRATASALTLTAAAGQGCPPGVALFGGTWHRRT